MAGKKQLRSDLRKALRRIDALEGSLADAQAQRAARAQSPAVKAVQAQAAVAAFRAGEEARQAAERATLRGQAERVLKSATSVAARQAAQAYLDSLDGGGGGDAA